MSFSQKTTEISVEIAIFATSFINMAAHLCPTDEKLALHWR
jgi:hypothetical protein